MFFVFFFCFLVVFVLRLMILATLRINLKSIKTSVLSSAVAPSGVCLCMSRMSELNVLQVNVAKF